MTEHSLKNQFLIATPNLNTGIFKSSLTYICEHSEEGAMGIIVNRPSTLSVQDIVHEVASKASEVSSKEAEDSDVQTQINDPVMVGGPVGLERGFVLHQSDPSAEQWNSSLKITSDIILTGSKDILLALGEGRGPSNYLVVLGYAGWEAGQLEQELAENAWLTAPAKTDILFSTPYHLRAEQVVKQLGIDFASLATTAGNA